MGGPTTHLWIERPQRVADQLIVSCTLERPDSSTTSVWYQLPHAYAAALNPRVDAFIIAVLFTAMRIGRPLRVHGVGSASLLRNLEEFQAAWARWLPSQYSAVDITLDRESTEPLSSMRDQAIFGFSGGVDSMFTLYRHTHQIAGRRSRRLGAGLLAHGFDIPLTHAAAFTAVATTATRLLNQHGVDLIPLATNFRDLGDTWEHAFAAALAACLHLFAGRYHVGLIGSSEPYEHLVIPWGSSPITDHLLSADDFPIVHDGAECARIDKTALIGRWEEALRDLRVCWVGPRFDANCGICEKCIRTILCFRVLGLGLPPCFSEDVTNGQILALNNVSEGAVAELKSVLEAAHARHIEASWVEALKSVVRRYRVGND